MGTAPVICYKCSLNNRECDPEDYQATYRTIRGIPRDKPRDSIGELYPELYPKYWDSTHLSLETNEYVFIFIACKNCIGENKKLFDHIPDGWNRMINIVI